MTTDGLWDKMKSRLYNDVYIINKKIFLRYVPFKMKYSWIFQIFSTAQNLDLMSKLEVKMRLKMLFNFQGSSVDLDPSDDGKKGPGILESF